ncbi:hypothetical protein ACI6PS_10335 [Flavobacterium sp. PLA-1-15]|uniref:hypothetical protein n=1 Tax=Flavobacterium sp. PLA-1-15 TaxID=3380533 RepID=UPI003B785387
MYKELKKFKTYSIFGFRPEESLETVCNAPEDGSGVFLVYDIVDGERELIMVGSTGTIQNDGTLKSKNGGLYDKIVNGHQFAKTGRKYSWPAQMKLENMGRIEVDWFVTFNEKNKVIPTFVEGQILQNYLDENGKLPRWNVAF